MKPSAGTGGKSMPSASQRQSRSVGAAHAMPVISAATNRPPARIRLAGDAFATPRRAASRTPEFARMFRRPRDSNECLEPPLGENDVIAISSGFVAGTPCAPVIATILLPRSRPFLSEVNDRPRPPTPNGRDGRAGNAAGTGLTVRCKLCRIASTNGQFRAPRLPDNPSPETRVALPEFDLVVIGGGAGGLVVAAGGAALGAKVALVEKHKMGGDCLWYGCVPSKSLIKSARIAHQMRHADRWAIAPAKPEVDLAQVMERVAGVIRGIEPNDSPERFRGLGVDVILGDGRFTGPDVFEVAGRRLTARHFVIATGSRPSVPSIPGLADVPFLTNETVFRAARERTAPAHHRQRPDRLPRWRRHSDGWAAR